MLWLDRDTLTDPLAIDLGTNRDDPACCLVTEYQGRFDDVLADSAVPEVVRVGSADTHRTDSDQYLVTRGPWRRALLQLDDAGRNQHACTHRSRRRLRRRECCVRHILMLAYESKRARAEHLLTANAKLDEECV